MCRNTVDVVPFTDVPNAGMLALSGLGTAVLNDAASWETFGYEHTTMYDGEGQPSPFSRKRLQQ